MLSKENSKWFNAIESQLYIYIYMRMYIYICMYNECMSMWLCTEKHSKEMIAVAIFSNNFLRQCFTV